MAIFLSRGLITANLNDWGIYSVDKERLIKSSREALNRGKASLGSLVGMQSGRQVDGFE